MRTRPRSPGRLLAVAALTTGLLTSSCATEVAIEEVETSPSALLGNLKLPSYLDPPSPAEPRGSGR